MPLFATLEIDWEARDFKLRGLTGESFDVVTAEDAALHVAEDVVASHRTRYAVVLWEPEGDREPCLNLYDLQELLEACPTPSEDPRPCPKR